eukprot:TRINITY_DN12883_c0_g1_i1.p1 TRINITY_DN12883_c0_g1~~TRINITY_DN12883_c0_g1_i1.p1  ORF type:complete len:738 (-),score=213.11 TRINITY_DN12883_c0_g1_i1:220-2433(-)
MRTSIERGGRYVNHIRSRILHAKKKNSNSNIRSSDERKTSVASDVTSVFRNGSITPHSFVRNEVSLSSTSARPFVFASSSSGHSGFSSTMAVGGEHFGPSILISRAWSSAGQLDSRDDGVKTTTNDNGHSEEEEDMEAAGDEGELEDKVDGSVEDISDSPSFKLSKKQAKSKKMDSRKLEELWNKIKAIPDSRRSVLPILKEMLENDPDFHLTRGGLSLLIQRLRARRYWGHAIQLSKWMLSQPALQAQPVDYHVLLLCLTRKGFMKYAQKAFWEFPQRHRTEQIYSPILNHYARVGNLEQVQWHMEKLTEGNVQRTQICYNSLIMAHSKRDEFEAAEEILKEMKIKGFPITKATYNIMISASGLKKRIADMERYLKLMEDDDIAPDAITLSAVVISYVRADELEKADKALEGLRKTRNGMNMKFLVNLMWTYAHGGHVGKVEKVFKEIQDMKLPIIRQMFMARITGLANAGLVEAAEKMFQEMVDAGHAAMTDAQNCLLYAYAHNGQMEKAKALLQEIKESEKIRPDGATFNILIEVAIKSNDLEEAVKYLEETSEYSGRLRGLPYRVAVQLVHLLTEKGEMELAQQAMAAAGKIFNVQVDVFNMMLEGYARKLEAGTVAAEAEELRRAMEALVQEMEGKRGSANEATDSILARVGLERVHGGGEESDESGSTDDEPPSLPDEASPVKADAIQGDGYWSSEASSEKDENTTAKSHGSSSNEEQGRTSATDDIKAVG